MCSAHISHAALSCPLQKAFNALCHSTHLYGRRLVLEWADSEVTVQALRRKTARHFQGRSGLALAWLTGGLLGLGVGAGAACGAALAWVQPPHPPRPLVTNLPCISTATLSPCVRVGRWGPGKQEGQGSCHLGPYCGPRSRFQKCSLEPRDAGNGSWRLAPGTPGSPGSSASHMPFFRVVLFLPELSAHRADSPR